MLTEVLPLAAPALPLDEAGKYVAGAYVVFVVLLLIYVAIMAAKLQRIERELRELAGDSPGGRDAERAREASRVVSSHRVEAAEARLR